MFDKLDLSQLGGMIQEIQKKSEEITKESENKIFTAKSGGGMVSVSMNGKAEIIDISIDDSLLSDKESLQILLIAACNDCMHSVDENRKNDAMGMLGGFNPFGMR